MLYLSVADLNRLPSEGWSRELVLTSFEEDNSPVLANKNKIDIHVTDQILVFYSLENKLFLETFDMNFQSLSKEEIYKHDKLIDGIHVNLDDGYQIIIDHADTYTFIDSKDLKTYETKASYKLKHKKFKLDLGILQKDGQDLLLLDDNSSRKLDTLGAISTNAYTLSKQAHGYILIYVTLVDGQMSLVKSSYDNRYVLLEHDVLDKLKIQEMRYDITGLDADVYGEKLNVMVNQVDQKEGIFFLQVLGFDKDKKTYDKQFTGFRQAQVVPGFNQALFTVRGSQMLERVGKHYKDTHNIVKARFDDKSYDLLTRTKHVPLSYRQLVLYEDEYLIWTEKIKDKYLVYYATDNKSLVEKSQVLSLEKVFRGLENMIDSFATLFFFLVIVGIFTFFIVMTPVLPFYLFKYSLVEKYSKFFRIGVLVLHNLVIYKVHEFLSSNIVQPELLKSLMLPLMLLANIYCLYAHIYSKNIGKKGFVVDYFAFLLPYMFIYSTLVAPFLTVI